MILRFFHLGHLFFQKGQAFMNFPLAVYSITQDHARMSLFPSCKPFLSLFVFVSFLMRDIILYKYFQPSIQHSNPPKGFRLRQKDHYYQVPSHSSMKHHKPTYREYTTLRRGGVLRQHAAITNPNPNMKKPKTPSRCHPCYHNQEP